MHPIRTGHIPRPPSHNIHHPAPPDFVRKSEDALQTVLANYVYRKQKKAAHIPAYTDLPLFRPIVLTSGGYTDNATTDLLEAWKKFMSPRAFSTMLTQISIVLTKARAVGMKLE